MYSVTVTLQDGRVFRKAVCATSSAAAVRAAYTAFAAFDVWYVECSAV